MPPITDRSILMLLLRPNVIERWTPSYSSAEDVRSLIYSWCLGTLVTSPMAFGEVTSVLVQAGKESAAELALICQCSLTDSTRLHVAIACLVADAQTQTADRISALIGQIQYKDWVLRWGVDGETPWLQWVFLARDAIEGSPKMQKARKHRLSLHMTPGEVVRTAFHAALVAEEHEARELFRYKGRAVFGPHLSVEALWAVAGETEQRAAMAQGGAA